MEQEGPRVAYADGQWAYCRSCRSERAQGPDLQRPTGNELEIPYCRNTSLDLSNFGDTMYFTSITSILPTLRVQPKSALLLKRGTVSWTGVFLFRQRKVPDILDLLYISLCFTCLSSNCLSIAKYSLLRKSHCLIPETRRSQSCIKACTFERCEYRRASDSIHSLISESARWSVGLLDT